MALFGVAPDMEEEYPDEYCTVVIVGDHAVGKTISHLSFISQRFCHDPHSVFYQEVHPRVSIDKRETFLTFRDTNSDEMRLRQLCYSAADVFLVMFAVDSPSSFASVINKWVPEVQRIRPGVPFLVMGSKLDLRPRSRKSPEQSVVIESQQQVESLLMLQFPPDLSRLISQFCLSERVYGLCEVLPAGHVFVDSVLAQQEAIRVGASGYFESSAVTQEGLAEAYRQAVILHREKNLKKNQKSKNCALQ